MPLHHYYATTPLHETITDLLAGGQAPIYVVHFTQAAALEHAQSLTSINVATRAERDLIAAAIGDFRFTAGFGRVLSRLVRHGIGVHHAGMLPKYRRLVEQLAQAGLLKVICGTDTLGVGINVPIRTVVFAALSKYDGQRTRQLQVREFLQIAGRAGRAGFDTAGTVVVQAPEHEVENERLLAKAGDDVKKRRRIVRKKAPEGFVSWGRNTHERLQTAAPEQLTSHFQVTPAMVLNVIARPGNAFTSMRELIFAATPDPAARRRHVRAAIRAYRALLAAGVIERADPPDDLGRTVRLVADLPVNFALNQPLSTFALAALDLLDQESETYALDVVSVLESTLEDPRQVLAAQQNMARGEAVAAMKADGLEYEERMELLTEVTYPKPLDELLSAAFAIYRQSHPWLVEDQLSPKSVVRDMWERAMTFTEYVAFYGLTRSEGLVLRYLTDAYRALRSGVPDAARTEAVSDIVEWLGTLVRQVDSSLLDEWEQLTSGATVESGRAGPTDRSRNPVGQHPRVHHPDPQRALPAGGVRGPAAVRRPRRAGRRIRLGCRRVARRARPLLRRVRPHRHRRRCPQRGLAACGRRRSHLAGPPGVRRPGRRPRLGHHRRGRSRRERCRRRTGDHGCWTSARSPPEPSLRAPHRTHAINSCESCS